MKKRILLFTRFATMSAAGLLMTSSASAQSETTTINESPGNYSRDTTVTGPNGKSATYQNHATWGNGAYTDTKSYTDVNGASRTNTKSRSGGIVTDTLTRRNGTSRTVSHFAHYRR